MLPLLADAAPPGQNLLQSIGTQNLMLYGAIAAGILVLLVLLIFLMSRGKKRVNPESGLDEDLSEYPPAPGKPGSRRLTVHGRPVRLRLVVVAPVGKRAIAEGGVARRCSTKCCAAWDRSHNRTNRASKYGRRS